MEFPLFVRNSTVCDVKECVQHDFHTDHLIFRVETCWESSTGKIPNRNVQHCGLCVCRSIEIGLFRTRISRHIGLRVRKMIVSICKRKNNNWNRNIPMKFVIFRLPFAIANFSHRQSLCAATAWHSLQAFWAAVLTEYPYFLNYLWYWNAASTSARLTVRRECVINKMLWCEAESMSSLTNSVHMKHNQKPPKNNSIRAGWCTCMCMCISFCLNTEWYIVHVFRCTHSSYVHTWNGELTSKIGLCNVQFSSIVVRWFVRFHFVGNFWCWCFGILRLFASFMCIRNINEIDHLKHCRADTISLSHNNADSVDRHSFRCDVCCCFYWNEWINGAAFPYIHRCGTQIDESVKWYQSFVRQGKYCFVCVVLWASKRDSWHENKELNDMEQ